MYHLPYTFPHHSKLGDEEVNTDKSRGIQWDLLSHLKDLDFADDLAILSTNLNNMQEKSSLLNKYSNQTGLHISTTKTKAMKINSKTTSQIKTGDTLI